MTSPAFEKQILTYKTVNGHAIEADVFISQPPAPRPVLLWLHGGALINGTRGQLLPYQLEKYLQAGFTVVSVDYRLAPGTKLEQIIEDLRDAYRWVLTEGPQLFGLDGERVTVMGQSAGGYLTLMTGICVQPRPRALVAFYGYGDIIGDWYSRPDPFYCQQPLVPEEEVRHAVGNGIVTNVQSKDRSNFYLYCRQTGRWPIEVAGHDPELEPDWFTPYCPAQNVTEHYPPTLLVHGVLDTDVPYAQSVLMAEQLAAHKVEHKLITSPSGGHGFDRGAGAEGKSEIISLFDQVIEFLVKHG